MSSDYFTRTQAEQLHAFLEAHPRCFVVTGAGCSTESGIPAYRDDRGELRHRTPITYQQFVGSAEARRRYWARSVVGYARVREATPSRSHLALHKLEQLGRLRLLVTQNVDGLHQATGSRKIVALHGNLAQVRCLQCGDISGRDELQRRLCRLNPQLTHPSATRDRGAAPDGDAALEGERLRGFAVADCLHCSGLLKPHVVFFGETVPADHVQQAYRNLAESDALLVVGSSLMVFSGYRFAKRAAALGLPIVIVNRGFCRAASLATFQLSGSCGALLEAAVGGLAPAKATRGL